MLRTADRNQTFGSLEQAFQSLDDRPTIHFIEHLPTHLGGLHDLGFMQYLQVPGDHRALLWQLFGDFADIRPAEQKYALENRDSGRLAKRFEEGLV